MKYFITGIIVMFLGIALGAWHLLEAVPEPTGFLHGPRPISVKKLLAPYLLTFGLIITFAGVISVFYNRPKKKQNYYKR